MLNGCIANASVLFRVSRTWADDKLSGLLCDELIKGNLIIAIDSYECTLKDKVLIDVPGERVVVVNEDDIGGGGYRRRGVGIARRVVNQADG